jgi:hypothetical protein
MQTLFGFFSFEKTFFTQKTMKHFFLNYKIDKQELKRLLSWFVQKYGSAKTSRFADSLKHIGFHYAMQAGISIGLDDLQIPPLKENYIVNAQNDIDFMSVLYERGEVTPVEKFRKLIDTWAWTSENVKKEVIRNFIAFYPLNTVYMMASSGARGNMAQVRQLVGMRGLMSDPKGDLLDFAIQSNFREGLTVVEYIISCYGSRKGVVDTALRTANSGYLTRRLIEVSQEISISQVQCLTPFSFNLTGLENGKKFETSGGRKGKSRKNLVFLLSLEKRLVGRVLAKTLHPIFAPSNADITPFLAKILGNLYSTIPIRSPFTCTTNTRNVCQFCYGWGLADSKLVSIGEAVGVLAAQSIGEPGTQLTMRTFHTGGVFSSIVEEKLVSPIHGLLFFSKKSIQTLFFQEKEFEKIVSINSHFSNNDEKELKNISGKMIRTRKGETVFITFTPLLVAIIEIPKVETTQDEQVPFKVDFDMNEEETIEFSKNKKITYFQIPAFAFLFLFPGSFIQEAQILAESLSEFQVIRDTTTYADTLEILSIHSGQISFNDLYLLILNDPNKPFVAYQHGSIWIISGEIFIFNNKFFRGDLIQQFNPGSHAKLFKKNETNDFFLKSDQKNFKSKYISNLKLDEIELRIEEEKNPSSINTERFSLSESKNLFLTRRNIFFGEVFSTENTFLLSNPLMETNSRMDDLPFPMLGSYLFVGQYLTEDLITDQSGLLFQVTRKLIKKKTKDSHLSGKKRSQTIRFFIRQVTPYAVGKTALVYVKNGEIISSNHILFVLQYTREKTGDIVQGLPKIEQLFEARTKKGFDYLIKNPKNLTLGWFFSLRSRCIPFNQSTLISLQIIQYFLLNGIQRVYLNQGVTLSDKHFELIIKEMTSVVLVIEPGWTAFIPGELVHHYYIRQYNTIHSHPAIYIPLVIGITKLGLIDSSFLSAASFQQTRKILMYAALHGSRDSLDYMKQSIMIGKLIPVGAANTFVLKTYLENIFKKMRKPFDLRISFREQKQIQLKKEKEAFQKEIEKQKLSNQKRLEKKQKKDAQKKIEQNSILTEKTLIEFDSNSQNTNTSVLIEKKKRGPYKKKNMKEI